MSDPNGNRAAAAFYEFLKERGQIKSHLVVTYRCPRRCTLLQVLTTKAGLIVHQSRYKLSPTRNAETSSAAGRMKHTEDGNNHWKGRTLMLSESLDFAAQCDHVDQRAITNDQIKRDVAARHAEVTISPL